MSQNGAQRPWYFIVEMPATKRWQKTPVPQVGTNVNVIAFLERREAMGMFVVTLNHLDLPRRSGNSSVPTTPQSQSSVASRSRRRALDQSRPAVQIPEDDPDLLQGPQTPGLPATSADTTSSASGSVEVLAGDNQGTPADITTEVPVTPTPSASTRGSKRKAAE